MIVKPRQGSCILLSVFKWRAVLVNLPAWIGAQVVTERHPPFYLFFVQNSWVCLSIHCSQDTEIRSKDWIIHGIDPQTGTVVSPVLITLLSLSKGARLWLGEIPVFLSSPVCDVGTVVSLRTVLCKPVYEIELKEGAVLGCPWLLQDRDSAQLLFVPEGATNAFNSSALFQMFCCAAVGMESVYLQQSQ